MSGLRIGAIFVIVVSLFVWLFAPFLTVTTWGRETSTTALSLLLDNTSEMHMTFWLSLLSLLALVFSFIHVMMKKPSNLKSSAGLGMGCLGFGLGRLFIINRLSEQMLGFFSDLNEERFDIGFYFLLIAFFVLFCLGCALKTEDETSTSSATRTHLSKSAKQSADTKTVTDAPMLTCCQCGKAANRTEFYQINVNGNANLGVCHQCYDKFY